jgi:hypothetical protein
VRAALTWRGGAGLGPSLLSGFTAVAPRPPPVASFSLCDLRLFVIKRTYSLQAAARDDEDEDAAPRRATFVGKGCVSLPPPPRTSPPTRPLPARGVGV